MRLAGTLTVGSVCLLLLGNLASRPLVARQHTTGVVVEAVQGGQDAVAISEGSVLTHWERRGGTAPGSGELRSPFDLLEVEEEQGGRGPVTLSGVREERPFSVTLSSAAWGIAARPHMEARVLAAYEEGRTAVNGKRADQGIEHWRQAAAMAAESGALTTAAWLSSRTAGALRELPVDPKSRPRLRDQIVSAFADATRAAQATTDPIIQARALEAEADALASFGAVADSSDRFLAALNARAGGGRQTLAAARILRKQSRVCRESTVPRLLGDLARRGFAPDDEALDTLKTADTALSAAFDIAQRVAPDSRAVAAILRERALVAARKGELVAAQRFFDQAQSIDKRAPGEAGEAAQTRQWFDEMKKWWEITASSWANGGERFIDEQAYLADVQRDLGRATTVYEQLYPGCDAAAGNPRATLQPGCRGLAHALDNLGIVTAQRGDPAAGQRFIERALAINEALRARRIFDKPSRTRAAVTNDAAAASDITRSYNHLGTVAWLRGDFDTAADYYQRPDAALRQCGRPCERSLALTNRHLAKVHAARGASDQAIKLYEEALAIDQRILTAADPRFSSTPMERAVATDYKGLADLAHAAQDYEKAADHYTEALRRQREAVPRSLEIVETLTGLGTLAGDQADLEKAQSHLREALSIASEVVPESVQAAAAAHALARVLVRARLTEEAATYYRNAITMLERSSGRLGGAEDVRSRFVARYSALYHDLATLLVDRKEHEAAFAVTERSRAQSLRSLLAERDVSLADLPAPLARELDEVNREYELTDARLRLEMDDPNVLRPRLRQLRDRRDSVARRVREASPRAAAVQYPEPLDLGGVRAVLDPGTLLLSYSVGEYETFLFAVQPGRRGASSGNGLQVFRLQVGRAGLQEDVRQLLLGIGVQSGPGASRSTVESAPSPSARLSVDDVSAKLFETLVRPAYPLVAASTRVLISADGPLHALPFAALLEGGATAAKGRYLVEWKPLHLIVSASVYAEMRKRRWTAPPADPPIIALGDPYYAEAEETDQDRREVRRVRGKITRLVSSRGEVERIAELYPKQARILLDRNAGEPQVKQMASGSTAPMVRYLHIASHGFVDNHFPLNSALVLSSPASVAGSDNGLLQAWEIYEQLNMDADLVTLSACETARGEEIGGEGLVSLSRAFLYAGAHSVLASLWQVNDESTADLMGGFYAALKEGRTKDEALRAAQLQLLRGRRSAANAASGEDWSRPYHWAAFTLSGDWR